MFENIVFFVYLKKVVCVINAKVIFLRPILTVDGERRKTGFFDVIADLTHYGEFEFSAGPGSDHEKSALSP